MRLDKVYRTIANNISDAIEAQWYSASIIFEVEDDACSFFCVYIQDVDSVVRHYFNVNYELCMAFKDLYEVTTEDEKTKWNRAKFTLKSTGEFNIDYEWDQCMADEAKANSEQVMF